MKFKVGDRVKYVGVRRKGIIGQIGIVVDTKKENISPLYLREDECAVDFGFEDECEYVLREKQLVLVDEGEPK